MIMNLVARLFGSNAHDGSDELLVGADPRERARAITDLVDPIEALGVELGRARRYEHALSIVVASPRPLTPDRPERNALLPAGEVLHLEMDQRHARPAADVGARPELALAERAPLSRSIYNVAAFSPTAQEIAQSVQKAIPGVRITFAADPPRQAILDSWPRALDDTAARRDWGWQPAYDLDAMTADLVPQIRELVDTHPDRFASAH